MNLVTGLFVITTTIFGFAAVILSVLEEHAKKQVKKQKDLVKEISFKNAIIPAMNEKITRDPDIDSMVEELVGNLRNLMPYSTASSLTLKDSKLTFKVYAQERISFSYVKAVKKSMVDSLLAVSNQVLPVQINESISGIILDDENTQSPISYFHIPIWVQGTVKGVFSITSTQKNAFSEQEMTALYHVIHQASVSLSHIQNILTTEKTKLTSMIASLADGVFMVENDSELTMINDAALKLLNITKPSPTLFDIFIALPFDYNLQTKIQQAIQNGKATKEQELNVADRLMQVFITPVFDYRNSETPDNPKALGVSVLLHDITLEKSMAQMKEDFTHMMVHELRAPLTVIKGSADLMMTSKSLTAEETTRLLGIMKEQSVKLLDDVSSILDAAKLEAGKFTIEKTMGDLKSVLAERIEFFTPEAHNKNITVIDKVEDHLPPLLFDPKRIAQVVNNLMTNSLKFTPEGGSITLTTKHDDKTITISVSDTGMGIPKEQQSALFKKYSQVSGSGTQHKGTGLGLFIVDGIVKAHGGTITLESEPTKGTTFFITIPFATEELTKSNTTHMPIGPIQLRSPAHPPAPAHEESPTHLAN